MDRRAAVALVRRLRELKIARPRRRVPRALQPDAVRLEYYQGVKRYLDAARRVAEQAVVWLLRDAQREKVDHQDAPPRVPTFGAHAAGDLVAYGEGTGKRVNAAMDRAADLFWEEVFRPHEVEALAHLAAQRTDAFQKRQFDRQVRAGLGADVFGAEPRLAPMVDNWVAENVALIKSVPSRYFDDVEVTVARGVAQGRRWEDIARDLVGDDENPGPYSKQENRARLVARDQVGKLYGQINEARQTALGVDGYTWRTAGDNRVREEHELREGQKFSWADPPEDGHPGEAVNCRCTAEPDLGALLGNDE